MIAPLAPRSGHHRDAGGKEKWQECLDAAMGSVSNILVALFILMLAYAIQLLMSFGVWRFRCKHRTEAGRHCANRRLRRSGLYRRTVTGRPVPLGYVRSLRTDFPVVIPHRRRRYLSTFVAGGAWRQHRSPSRYDHRILRYPGRTGYRQNQTPGCLVSFLLNLVAIAFVAASVMGLRLGIRPHYLDIVLRKYSISSR